MADVVPFRVDHIAILVRSIDESLAYYRDRLGLAVIGDEVVPAAAVRLVYLDAGGAMIQLVQPIGPGAMASQLATHGEGLHHLCYAVPDLEAAAGLIAPGAEIRPIQGGRGQRTAFLPMPINAVITELTESEP